MRMVASKMLLALLAVAMVGCKFNSHDPNSSSTKTVDAFAANAKIRGNECRFAEDVVQADGTFNSGKYAAIDLLANRINLDDVPPSDRNNLRNEVLIALTAVPAYSQGLFLKMSGYIRVTPRAATLCGAVLGDASNPNYADKSVRDTIESCTLLTDGQSNDAEGKDRNLALVINASADSIRHNLVRGFGYLHSQFYPRLRRNLSGNGPLFVLDSVDTAEMLAFKDNLARSFLSDMVESDKANSVFKIETLAYLLGTSSTGRSLRDSLDANLHSPSGDLFAGLTLTYPGETRQLSAAERTIRAQRIRDTLAANSYDSLYCRPQGAYSDAMANTATKPEDLASLTNTVKVFQHFFAKTYGYYANSVAPALQMQADQLGKAIDSKGQAAPRSDFASGSNSAPGLGLTGSNDLVVILQALLGGFQQPASTASVSNVGRDSGIDSLISGGLRPNGNSGTDNANINSSSGGISDGQSGGGCPCGCCGGNCNCSGCAGGNCPCCGGGGGGNINV